VPDTPTLGEVMRRLEDVRQDLKEDFRELGQRLDSKVSMERYQLEQLARDETIKLLVERVKGIEDARLQEARQADADRRAAEAQRRADKRLIFSALIVPVLLVFLQVYLATRGAGA
jgi:cytochrome c-type biogenesis protein CcmH/NrfG